VAALCPRLLLKDNTPTPPALIRVPGAWKPRTRAESLRKKYRFLTTSPCRTPYLQIRRKGQAGTDPPPRSTLINITYFATKASQATPAPRATETEVTQEGPLHHLSELPVTYRGIVYPWQLDHMNHMNVQHYTASFDHASWVLLAMLGLDAAYFQRHRRGVAALEQHIEYRSELRAGDAFEIRSIVLDVRDKTIRLKHEMRKVRTGALAASTTILGVHIDTDARSGIPLPPGVRDRIHLLSSSLCDAAAGEWSQTCEQR